MFDPSKPIQTRSGKPARIVATDVKHPVGNLLVLINNHGQEIAVHRKADGQCGSMAQSPDDIVNVPERKSIFLNVYAAETSKIPHTTLRDAELFATPRTRDTIEIVSEDGVVVDIIIHHR